MKNNTKGQAAILIIFVIGMVGLLVGMSLSKTGFAESLMGRGSAASTYAFYVANAGIEDAFYKIQKAEEGKINEITQYSLKVGNGVATITINDRVVEKDEDYEIITRVITSTGNYENYARKIKTVVFTEIYKPEFAKIIQADTGGIEIEGNVKISGRYKDGTPADVSIFSNSFVRGQNFGVDSSLTCDTGASSWIDGNVYAVESIEKLGHGDGPCITKNAFAKNLTDCRIYGKYFSEDETVSQITCPHDEDNFCDPSVNPNECKIPENNDLPNMDADKIKEIIGYDNEFFGDCIIGNPDDEGKCYINNNDGSVTIGKIIIDGNLITNSSLKMYISGLIYVKGNIDFASNQVISLDPGVIDKTSLIILSEGRIIANSNTNFTSEDNTFLLLASTHDNPIQNEDGLDYVCKGDDDIDAITIDSNVNGILFYAINGCAYIRPSAGKEFFGAIIGRGVKIGNNVSLVYDPALENAEFSLTENEGWQISSFTEL